MKREMRVRVEAVGEGPLFELGDLPVPGRGDLIDYEHTLYLVNDVLWSVEFRDLPDNEVAVVVHVTVHVEVQA